MTLFCGLTTKNLCAKAVSDGVTSSSVFEEYELSRVLLLVKHNNIAQRDEMTRDKSMIVQSRANRNPYNKALLNENTWKNSSQF